jgi:ParB family transcriptional regulator, chromosome partitioning protein
LNPLDEANGIQRLIEEFGMTHESAARAVGRSRSAVTNLLRLLNLPPAVQAYLVDGRIEMGHARALLAASPSQQENLAERVAAQSLSVRETEELVTKQPDHVRTRVPRTSTRNRDLLSLEERLSDSLGTRVKIFSSISGRGKLVIDFASVEQLEPILARLAPTK